MAEDNDLAMQLARQKMSEISMQLEDDIAKGSFPDDKEEHGDFDKPFDRFKWTYTLKKVEIPVVNPPADGGAGGATGSGSTSGSSSSSGSSGSTGATTPGVAQAANNVAQIVSKKISESVRELKLTVTWGEAEKEEDLEKLVLTTHLVNLK
jgi:hypothetical protein